MQVYLSAQEDNDDHNMETILQISPTNAINYKNKIQDKMEGSIEQIISIFHI